MGQNTFANYTNIELHTLVAERVVNCAWCGNNPCAQWFDNPAGIIMALLTKHCMFTMTTGKHQERH